VSPSQDLGKCRRHGDLLWRRILTWQSYNTLLEGSLKGLRVAMSSLDDLSK
jgi:hypothetical protein